MTSAARARLARDLVGELRSVKLTASADGVVRGRDPEGVPFEVVVGEGETAIYFESIGALFISSVADRTIVEAVAISALGEPRAVIQARHDELERRGRSLFGDRDLDVRDPLGLRGGKRAVFS